MAEVVSEMPPTATVRRKASYPWEQWLDGQIWKLKQGEDFDITARNFQINISHARKRYRLEIATRRVGDTVFIRAMRDSK